MPKWFFMRIRKGKTKESEYRGNENKRKKGK